MRENAEKELESGICIKESAEVKKNLVAHKTYKRLEEWLNAIDKNDVSIEAIINRYCLLTAECSDLLKQINETTDEKKLDMLDKQIMTRRRMLMDIEKECFMTGQSAMRGIPKKPEPKTEDPLETFIKGIKSG